MNILSVFCLLLACVLQKLVSCDDGYGTKILTVCSKACGESASDEGREDMLECQSECQTNLVNLLLKQNGKLLRGKDILKKKHGFLRRTIGKILKPARTILGIRKKRNHIEAES